MNLVSCGHKRERLPIVNVFSFVAVIPLIVEEEASATLRCPHPVEEKVTWSRELGGSKVDILTTGGGRDIKHVEDPHKQYSSQADKSLHIFKVTTSDSGRYFCNREEVVELTVIPAGNI